MSRMLLTERYLLEGAWLALEQCGRLLEDAALLYQSGSAATAVGIGMLAREELGRSSILTRLAEEVHAGRELTLDELEKAIDDHVTKQAAGQFTVAFSTPPGGGLGKLMDVAYTDTPTPESRAAMKDVDRVLNKIVARTPGERHLARLRAFFVDPNDDGTAWNRPATFAPVKAQELLMAAANDYSIFRVAVLHDARFEWLRRQLDDWADRPTIPPPTSPGGIKPRGEEG